MQIPFKGFLLSAIAVLLITLISKFTERRGAIFKSAILVMIIKGMIAPHTPPAAYFALLFQGVLGEIVFYKRTANILPVIVFALLVAMQSGFQRIITLTIFYGENIWHSINAFVNYLIAQFQFLNITTEINFSLIIILFYLSVHLIGGLLVGFLSHNVAGRIQMLSEDGNFLNEIKNITPEDELKIPPKKKKGKKLKTSHLLIVLLSAILIYLSITNQLNTNVAYIDVLIMLIRATVIILLWYFVLAPYAKNLITRLLKNRKNKYAEDVDNLLKYFPYLKRLIAAIWKYSRNKKGVARLTFLVNSTLVLYLFTGDCND